MPDDHENDRTEAQDGPPDTSPPSDTGAESAPPAKKTARKAAKKATKKAAAKKTATKAVDETVGETSGGSDEVAPAKKTARKRTAKKAAATAEAPAENPSETPSETPAEGATATAMLFQAPEATTPPRKRAARKTTKKAAAAPSEDADATPENGSSGDDTAAEGDSGDGSGEGEESGARRRSRRRGGRRRRKSGGEESEDASENGDQAEDRSGDEQDDEGGSSSSRRRRRRRRTGEDGDNGGGDSQPSSRARKPRNPEDEITALSGSTRLEAKKQRRREGREAGRRRAPIVSEAEFLARRESVDRRMVIRQRDDLTQIGVLEDKVLVEHYVARASQTSLIGNVYLGRVQNVLPSMEAAFIDIGKGRNAVLYAGEVNWKALGAKDGQPRKIESVLSSGQTILVQVTKDPIGHKGARLTGQVTLPGRFLVYVPDGTTSGISRKLPDTERTRLKTLLREVVPDTASVIVRTAAEGAAEEELTADVERLKARWTDIEAKIAGGQAPQLLYGEPDLTLKVVRDLFTEDFKQMVIQGEAAWDLVDGYVTHVAPDLRPRLERYDPAEHDDVDLFTSHRLDEQIAKGLDRKVWLPSGGSLIVDRTEAMTVIDVNTGKFTGSGGNLEETVTKNNLEAAEEVVRQLRLRDIGGIVVIDFIDMVLESNRDLVLRRLVECLGRDRTRHQVAEVTSLGLVQMTRKRIGTGLLEAFSEECQHCKGRGLLIHDHPIEPSTTIEEPERRGRRSRGGRGRNGNGGNGSGNGNGQPAAVHHPPSPADLAAMPRHEQPPADESDATPDATEEPVEAVTESVETDEDSSEDLAAVALEAEDDLDDTDPDAEDDGDDTDEPEPDPAPRLVTTTRRRSARRAAGPPASEASEVTEPVETDDDSDEESDASVFHVPVKRKGSRKR